ncbi:MAG: hypothetical protein QM669_00130 [Siphonobacter sp.]
MSQFLKCLVIFFLPFSLYAQISNAEFSNDQTVRIASGTFKSYSGVDGSPYVPSETPKKGWLVSQNKIVPAELRYNTYSGEVEYLQNGKLVKPMIPITEFFILAPDTMSFQNGYPAINKNTSSDFYQVLYDGSKTKLLRRLLSSTKTNNDAMSSNYGKKTIRNYEEYYAWQAGQTAATKLSDGTMHFIAITKKELLGLFPQQQEIIDEYLKSTNLKLKTWVDFAQVLAFLKQ